MHKTPSYPVCTSAGLAGLTIHPLAAAAAGQAADEDLPLLVAGMDAGHPPFGFRDSKTGEFMGFDVDIIRAIGRTAGFRVKVENIPFDGLIPALKTRTIDIAINDIGITAERAKSVDFGPLLHCRHGHCRRQRVSGHSKRKRFGRQTTSGNDRIDRRNCRQTNSACAGTRSSIR